MTDRLHIILLAGGKGTRFWPLSTPELPKQFLRLFGSRSLAQMAIDRVRPLVDEERIWIATDRSLEPLARQELPQIPPERFVIEPEARNTLPGIALACSRVAQEDPDAVVAILCADHLIRRVEEFRALLRAAATFAAQSDGLITFGIRPTRPETGYGYIRYDGVIGEVDGYPAYRVVTFTEKPSRELAEEFLRAGHFLWNSGMFVWNLGAFFEQLRAHQPAIARGLEELRIHPDRLETVYHRFPVTSIDYGLMEKADPIYVFPADIDWDDVGSWESVWNVWERDEEENAVRGDHLLVETRGCLVYGTKKLIVTLGVQDLIIVDSEDAILICPRDRAQSVRDLASLSRTRRRSAEKP